MEQGKEITDRIHCENQMNEDSKAKTITSPLRAIRANWIMCVGTYNEIKECGGEKTCPLFPFRLGKNPYRTKRVMTEEQRAAAIERLSAARESKGGE